MSKTKNQPPSGNQPYLNSWDNYSNSVRNTRRPLLLPITFGIDNGKIFRERMKAPEVKKLYSKGRKDIPKDWFKFPKLLPNPDEVVKHYLHYFRNDKNESSLLPETPLDIRVKRPVLLLFNFYHDNWRFTKDEPYRTHNDETDHRRNFVHVATMRDDKGRPERGLMLLNRHYCNPKGLKFDLCVEVNQTVNRRPMKTPIIIDPGTNNQNASFP